MLIDGKMLASERKRRGYSQVAFCNEFGLSRKVIKEVESNPQRRIQPQTLSAISIALGIQPQQLSRELVPPRLLTTSEAILNTNLEIVRTAKKFIYTTGSRSRDSDYLALIESSIEKSSSLSYLRVLFGTPATTQMIKHLRRVIEIRNGNAEPRESISIGIYTSTRSYPSEATICLNERMALLVVPSIHGAWRYDSAVVFEELSVIEGWRRWIEEMYRVGEPIQTLAQIAKFEKVYR